jgi:hypothetical protein
MARWREWLFRLLMRVDHQACDAYGLPATRIHHVDIDVKL